MNHSKHINEMSPELLRRAAQKQKERLKEMLFPNGVDDTSNLKQYNNSVVTADGYVNDTNGGGEPLTGDRFGKMLCKNYPFGYGYHYVRFAHPLAEDTDETDNQ